MKALDDTDVQVVRFYSGIGTVAFSFPSGQLKMNSFITEKIWIHCKFDTDLMLLELISLLTISSVKIIT